MLYSGSHYRAGVSVVHERKGNASEGMGTTGTTLTVTGIVRSARTAALIVLLMCAIGMPGVLARHCVRGG